MTRPSPPACPRILDTPRSVSVVNRQTLDDRQVDDPQEAVQNVGGTVRTAARMTAPYKSLPPPTRLAPLEIAAASARASWPGCRVAFAAFPGTPFSGEQMARVAGRGQRVRVGRRAGGRGQSRLRCHLPGVAARAGGGGGPGVVRCPMTPRGSLLALVLLLVAGRIPAARAELTWEQKTVELNADAKSSVLEARYRFTNAGDKAVDIQQVQTSCGCTTAALEQRHYEPGQTGEIVARFAVGDRVGLQKKTIMVTASDLPMPTALTLIVHIPQVLRLQPAFVTWQTGEDATAAKMIEIIKGDAVTTLENVSVQSSSPAMTTELQPETEGRKYRLSIRPQTTDHAFFATLTIRCRVGAEEKTFRAFASVQHATPAPRTPSPTPATE